MFSLNGITIRGMNLSMESSPLSKELLFPFYLDVLKFESSTSFSASKLVTFSIPPIYNHLLMIKIIHNNRRARNHLTGNLVISRVKCEVSVTNLSLV